MQASKVTHHSSSQNIFPSINGAIVVVVGIQGILGIQAVDIVVAGVGTHTGRKGCTPGAWAEGRIRPEGTLGMV